MAESLKVKVKCHACRYEMAGTAKYGKGHYVSQGLDFKFIAIGRLKEKQGGFRVKGKVSIVCPNCEVINEYEI